jgi:hypothetical protein
LVAKKIEDNRRRAIREQSLRELTPDERSFLVPYIHDQLNSRVAPLEDGIVGGLVAKDILCRATHSIEFDDFPYYMQPWARRYLKKHPDLLILSAAHRAPASHSK